MSLTNFRSTLSARGCAWFLAVFLLGSSTAKSLTAQSPWADKDLPLRDGLSLWLDAQAQPDAWKQYAMRGSPLADGQSFDVCFDGSGHGRHLRQRLAEAQPQFRQVEQRAFIRFDGENDFLSGGASAWRLEEFTLFLLAAPKSNPGGFRAWLSAGALGQNDYSSGFNIDQSYAPSPSFQTVNVEGNGFLGARDLLPAEFPFGEFRLIEVVAGADSVDVLVDGKSPAGSRPRERRPLALDEVILGARMFSNEPKPSFVQGYFDGDVAEVLLFDRALTADERLAVRDYLAAKHAGLNEAVARLDRDGGYFVDTVKDPPPVQMLIPGFTVKELPLELPNINNVLYRSDGKLVALAYGGDIFLLSDADGDGLEDTAAPFWENRGRLQGPIGMDLTPEGYQHGRGVCVASKGKCSLILDTDGDDRADKEIVVAEGWSPIPQRVDALGVAFDRRDGSIYFGLGTQNFADAYMPDSEGRARYRLDDERGAILRVSPDFTSREVVCTGVRFPVAMRFNSRGDLFCTDQEGATWLPNGNPFDELLHIERGRHYGFPPRHPQHLPEVIDEPSTFDYGPQHQSTCGLNFNEAGEDGRVFGPAWWRGDALVTGYSRGKLYRTQLVKTDAGFVAQNHLLACLNMLAADACVSPAGDLVVAVHSGGPDWGSGPAGKGKLYKIVYEGPEAPQPVMAWASSPREVQIAFDRPIDLDDLADLAPDVRIEHSRWTRAGDRFESLRPGYAVVQMQTATRRYRLPVQGVQVTPDRRTLLLNTAPHRSLDHYAITLPWKSRERGVAEDAALPQRAEIDLHYTLNGVEATLQSAEGDTLWQGWLPHVDLQAAHAFTAGSSSHEAFWKLAAEAQMEGASLTLRTNLDLSHMLRAVTQPGSQLDFEYPPERVTLVFRSNRPCEVRSDAARVASETSGGAHEARLTIESPGEALIPVEIMLPRAAGAANFKLNVSWRTEEDERLRPLPLRRLFVPWAETSLSAAGEAGELAARPAELEGGSWGRGRQVFFSEKAQCGKCHRVGGNGGAIGPDLSNLVHRDYRSVLRDIVEPSFAINPDHLSHNIVLQDGRVLAGVVRAAGDKLIVGDKEGKQIEIDAADVEELVPSPVSVMPEGIEKQLTSEAMRDLLTFLLTPPPRMPGDLPGAPAPRTRAEVEAVLAGADEASTKSRPLHIVLVAGPKDHGPGEHDYPAWLNVWGQLLEAAENVRVSRAMDWPSPQDLASADAIVFYQRGTWDDRRAADLDAFLKRGGGVSYIHYAVDGGEDPRGFAERIGLAWQGGASLFRHGELDLIFDSDHAIARNFSRVHFHDESYWRLKGDPARIDLLASGAEEDALQPLVWVREHPRGRVFVAIPGHYSWTFDDPLFRILLLRGIAWSAGEPVDRFNDLATLGARLQE